MSDGTPREEVITARGHRNVSATHASTIELTSDDYLTEAGDCIVGIEADRTPASFDDDFVEACRDSTATITLTLGIENGRMLERIKGRGHPELSFESDRSLVGRTSTYLDDRTVFVGADRAAGDLDRSFVRRLADGSRLVATLTVEPKS